MRIEVAPGMLAKTLDALPGGEAPIELALAAGEYREKCVVSRANVTLCGAGAEKARIVWGDGGYDRLEDGARRGTFRTATLRIDAPGVTLRDLTIENDAAPRERVGQAIALYADGDGFCCEDCRLIGRQDTLFTAPLPLRELQPGGFIGPKQFAPRTPQRHVYRRCRIEGDIDFIFGGAAAWFEECEIRSVDGREDRSAPYVGYATAASTPEGQRYGYVFVRCRFTHAGLPTGSVYLGRPWRDHARTMLVDCELGAHIHPDGFHDWDKTAARALVRYEETGSRGAGASSMRAPFVRMRENVPPTFEAFWAGALDRKAPVLK